MHQSGAGGTSTGAGKEPPRRQRGVDLYLDRELFPETFAADVDPPHGRGPSVRGE
jgi:hypothetical protein